jgi:lipopolysaccharide cholinephosphotransferase
MDDTYTGAQREALEILSIVHAVCVDMKIKYTIWGVGAIVIQYGMPFDFMPANSISIALPVPEYEMLIAKLKTVCHEQGLVVVDHTNTAQFDFLGFWVARPNRVRLAPERKGEEIYYYTRVSVIPIIYSGNTSRESRRLCRYIKHRLELLNARSPLPHKSFFRSPKSTYRRLRQKHYANTRQAERITAEALYKELMSHNVPTEYAVIATTEVMTTEMMTTEVVDFFGAETYISPAATSHLKEFYTDSVLERMEKVSDLRLCGGETLRRIQLIQLEMLVEIDRICRKHHLQYTIAFGTFLGAVRHKGFIPWDDDADVNMPYEDYKKLTEIIDSELDADKYYFRHQDKEEDCNITFGHLKRNGTIYAKPGRDGYKFHPGVFVDIVPLFNGAPNFFLHLLHTRICWFFRTACWAHMGADGERKFLKRFYYRQLAKIGNKKAYACFILFAAMFKQPSGKMAFFNGLDRSPYNIGFAKRRCFDDAVEIEFEGHKFLSPPDVEDVLRYCYGNDYLLLPPVRKRVPKHNAIIELGGLYSYDQGSAG